VGLDNGGHLGNSQNNYPLRGGKMTEFEGGLRQSAFVSGGFLPPQMRGKTTHALMHICVSKQSATQCPPTLTWPPT
jgi:arylsulfatase B